MALLSKRIFEKHKKLIVREVQSIFAWSNHHMDLLKAAKDITEQFDIKKVPNNLVNFAADRSVPQRQSKITEIDATQCQRNMEISK